MNPRGFTVMEILVALFIFSIVLLPLTELLVADSKFEKKYEQKQLAMLVAKNELEKAKRSYKKQENREYLVVMGGRAWKVKIVIDEKERAQVPGHTIQQVQPGIPGDRQTPDQPQTVAPSTIVKQFITVSVFRGQDTTVLAEFRVLKETYR